MLCEGEGEGEDGAAVIFALDRDLAAVGLDDMLDDGEAQARAAGLARAGLVHAVETFEDARQVLGHDADAGVGRVDGYAVLPALRRDVDAPAARRVLDGVVYQVDEDLLD